jgi:hypothetical protein
MTRRTVVKVVFAMILLLAAVVWAGFVGCATTMHASDAAGNGLTQAFAFLLGIALWVLLAALLLIAALFGEMPRYAKLAAALLHPASGAAAMATVDLLSRDASQAWMLIVPIVIPLLLVGYAAWACVPFLRRLVAARGAALAWGAVLLLTLLPWPLVVQAAVSRAAGRAQMDAEGAIREREAAEQEQREWTARFEQLARDAPLWEWRDYTEHGEALRQRALEGIRHLDRRQRDAEELLDHGLAFPMRELPDLDLAITPAFCQKARRFLADRVKSLSPAVPDRPYSWEKSAADPYLPAMRWLLDHDCDCRPEASAIEAAVKAYPPAPDRDAALARLARLRLPQAPPR